LFALSSMHSILLLIIVLDKKKKRKNRLFLHMDKAATPIC
jgi:hypothetical protein